MIDYDLELRRHNEVLRRAYGIRELRGQVLNGELVQPASPAVPIHHSRPDPAVPAGRERWASWIRTIRYEPRASTRASPCAASVSTVGKSANQRPIQAGITAASEGISVV